MSYYDMVQNVDTLNLDITIIKGRNLVPKDRNALGQWVSSDPYVLLFLADSLVHKTKVIKKTLNPTWHIVSGGDNGDGENHENDTNKCHYTTKLAGDKARELLHHTNPIQFVIYDRDAVGDDDCMGVVKYPLDIFGNNNGQGGVGAEAGDGHGGGGIWYPVQKGDKHTIQMKQSILHGLISADHSVINGFLQSKAEYEDLVRHQKRELKKQKQRRRNSNGVVDDSDDTNKKRSNSMYTTSYQSPPTAGGPKRRTRSFEDPRKAEGITPRRQLHPKTPKAESTRYLMSKTKSAALLSSKGDNNDAADTGATPGGIAMVPKTPHGAGGRRSASTRNLLESIKTPSLSKQKAKSSRYLMSTMAEEDDEDDNTGGQEGRAAIKSKSSGTATRPSMAMLSNRYVRSCRILSSTSKDPLSKSSHESSSHRRQRLSSIKTKTTSTTSSSGGSGGSSHRRRSSSLDPTARRRRTRKNSEEREEQKQRSSSPTTSSSTHRHRRSSLTGGTTAERSSASSDHRRRKSSLSGDGGDGCGEMTTIERSSSSSDHRRRRSSLTGGGPMTTERSELDHRRRRSSSLSDPMKRRQSRRRLTADETDEENKNATKESRSRSSSPSRGSGRRSTMSSPAREEEEPRRRRRTKSLEKDLPLVGEDAKADAEVERKNNRRHSSSSPTARRRKKSSSNTKDDVVETDEKENRPSIMSKLKSKSRMSSSGPSTTRSSSSNNNNKSTANNSINAAGIRPTRT